MAKKNSLDTSESDNGSQGQVRPCWSWVGSQDARSPTQHGGARLRKQPSSTMTSQHLSLPADQEGERPQAPRPDTA